MIQTQLLKIYKFIFSKDICFMLLLFANVIVMHLLKEPETTVERKLDLYLPFVHVCLDVCLIWALCGVLTLFNRKALYTLSFSITILWSFSNVIYSRFFGQYISLSVFDQLSANMKGLWWTDYAKIALRASDFIYIILLSAFCLFYKAVHNGSKKINWKTCILGPFIVLSFYYLVINPLMSYIKSKGSNIEFITEEDKYSGSFYTFAYANPDRQVLKYGIFRTQLLLPLLSPKSLDLSEDDLFLIRTGVYNPNSFYKNELMGENKSKNVVFILLESFLSITSDLIVDGIEITPTLNSLKKLPGTYYNENILQNTAAGESIDGQIIYWTGLFPLESEITISKIIGKDISCFPKMIREKLGYQTNIILPTKKNFWKQNELDILFGIDKEYEAISDDPISNYVGTDAMVFEKATRVPHDTKHKFFDILVSVSTHSPYDKKPDLGFPQITFPDFYSSEFCNYLEICHYTDVQIGRYIQWLKEAGLFENTIIIIASDHEAHKYGLKMPEELMNNYRLPFYIINASIEDSDLYRGNANQIDIFPTLLDVFQVDSNWRGLGCSLIRSTTYSDKNTEETKRISNMLIRSNWFEKQ